MSGAGKAQDAAGTAEQPASGITAYPEPSGTAEGLVTDFSYSYATKADSHSTGWAHVTRRGQFSRCTVADLVAWCEGHGQALADVEVSGGHVTYRETETEVERAKRFDSIERQRARQDEWERQTYERLRTKFAEEARQ